jgi:hypothetical protein
MEGGMTSLGKRKTRLIFTTCDTVRERGKLREVVIEAQTHYAVVRLAGMRKRFPISYATIYQTAAKIAAERLRAEKKAKRK